MTSDSRTRRRGSRQTFLRDVIREGGLPEELSLLDDRLVDQVAAAFQKDAWVERVDLGPQGIHAATDCRPRISQAGRLRRDRDGPLSDRQERARSFRPPICPREATNFP